MTPAGVRHPAGPPVVARNIDPRAVLDQLLAHGALNRDDISKLTGLTRVAVANSLDDLVERGFAEVLAGRRPGGGPASRRYGLMPGSASVVGVHLRHDQTAVAVANFTGEVLAEVKAPFQPGAHAAVTISANVRRASAEAGVDWGRVSQVVLGAPGVIDPKSREFTFAYLLPGVGPTLTAELRDAFHRRVVFENDTNLAAMAEAGGRHGAGASDLAYLWMGDGVGLGVVRDGRPHRGRHGWAGEIGYLPMPLGPDVDAVYGPPDSVHQLVSKAAVQALARRSRLPDDAAEAVQVATTAPSASGESFLEELGRRVGMVASVVAVAVNPGVIVFGGDYFACGGTGLLDRVVRQTGHLSPAPCELELPAVSRDPIALGAVRSALADVRDRIFGPSSLPRVFA